MKKTIVINYTYVVNAKREIEVPDDLKVRGKNSNELLEFLIEKFPNEDLDINCFDCSMDEIEDYNSQKIESVEIEDSDKRVVHVFYPTHRDKIKL